MDPSYYANLPVGAPPPGVVSNFDHPSTRATEVRITMGICLGITSVFIVLRLYVKILITHMWGWDDCEFLEMVVCLLLTVVGACILGWVRQSFRWRYQLP